MIAKKRRGLTMVMALFVTFLLTTLSLAFVMLMMEDSRGSRSSAWQVMAAETPRGCWFIGAEELKYLEAHVAAPSSGKPKPKAADGKPAASDGGYFAALTGLPAEARPRRLKMMPPVSARLVPCRVPAAPAHVRAQTEHLGGPRRPPLLASDRA